MRHTELMLVLVALGWCAYGQSARPNKPHIIYMLVDDWGWADAGYHRGNTSDLDLQTPNIDLLRQKDALELNRFYTYKICSPSRCAIQTGRNPIHVNVQNVLPEANNKRDAQGGWQGIPVNMTGIASVLRRAGYRTRAVGKWDVGMATPAHHPRGRGYESWLGYWHHANGYWTHTEGTCRLKTESVFDLWRYNATYDGPALSLANSPDCTQANQTAGGGRRCVYEERDLTDEVVRVLRSHDPSEPLFLFWSMHLVHMPLEVPDAYLDKFSFIEDEHRRHYHAMAFYMDERVGEVVSVLRETGLWSDALVVIHSDNGGEIMGAGLCGGNNWPLTGGKFSNWEGGIRVNALVSGGALPAERRGAREDGYVTAWDWYATFAGLAGEDPADAQAAAVGLPAIDSIDVWPTVAGTNSSVRTRIPIGDTTALLPNGDGKTRVGGLVLGDYKILVGAAERMFIVDQYVQTGPHWPNASSSLVPLEHGRECTREPEKGCLFNIKTDPRERDSLSQAQPDLFREMLAEMDRIEKTVYSPVRGGEDPAACKAVNEQYGGYWGPFAQV